MAEDIPDIELVEAISEGTPSGPGDVTDAFRLNLNRHRELEVKRESNPGTLARIDIDSEEIETTETVSARKKDGAVLIIEEKENLGYRTTIRIDIDGFDSGEDGEDGEDEVVNQTGDDPEVESDAEVQTDGGLPDELEDAADWEPGKPDLEELANPDDVADWKKRADWLVSKGVFWDAPEMAKVRALTEQGWTQREMAAALDVNQSTVSRQKSRAEDRIERANWQSEHESETVGCSECGQTAELVTDRFRGELYSWLECPEHGRVNAKGEPQSTSGPPENTQI